MPSFSLSCIVTALLLAWGLPAVAAPGPTGKAATSCSDLRAERADLPCAFDFTGFRERSAHIDAIEAHGPADPIHFNGKIYLVTDARTFGALSGHLRPGDQVVLRDGSWKDATLALSAAGSTEHPIIIRPQNSGGVTMTGESSITVSGSNIIIDGLSFRDGSYKQKGFTAIRLGRGAKEPCDACSLNRISITRYDPAPEMVDTIRSFYAVLLGRDITVSNSSFTDKQSAGALLLAEDPESLGWCEPGPGCVQRLLIANSVFSGVSRNVRRPGGDGNKYKIMQIGGAHGLSRSFSVIRDNVFEGSDGSTPAVDIKVSDVIVQGNKFQTSWGILDIREGNRVLIENNVFDGTNHDGMGGICISSRDHWIVHNLFKNLVKAPDFYRWPISIPAATTEELGNAAQDYARGKNIVIADNVFEDVTGPPVALGIYPSRTLGRLLVPNDIYLVDNAVKTLLGSPPRPFELQVGIAGYIGRPSEYLGIVQRNNLPIP